MARTPSTTAILEQAQTFLGTPYKWGGASPATGFDCSGFVQWLYAQQGVQIPRVTYDQVNAGTAVARGDLRPGDIVFFEPDGRGPGHEGLYLGNGKVIHSPHTGDVVKISDLSDLASSLGYVGARRIIPAGAPSLRTAVKEAAPPKQPAAPTATPTPAAEPPATQQAPAPVAPQIIPPPAAMPPLPGGGLPDASPALPGSVSYTLDRSQVASTWQLLANKYPASSPVQQFAYLSSLAAGDQ